MQNLKPKEWVFSNADLLAAVAAIKKKANLCQDYDIPYLAGYSEDGKTLYVDKDMPEGYASRSGHYIHAINFLLFHEGVEKAIIDAWGVKYLPAHAIAMRVEQDAVKASGVDDKEYNGFMAKWIKVARHKKRYEVPPDLDLTPYEGEEVVKAKMKVKK